MVGTGGGSAYTYSDGNQGSGGGATDIRLVNGAWNDFNSLKSRIMVAGAGGGMAACNGPWGHGGALKSNDAYYVWRGRTYIAYGSGQTGSGKGSYHYVGSFGKGADGANHNRTGGGGGYYGGSIAGTDYGGNAGAAAGGSSFVSGYDGCNAIAEESTENNIIHTGQSVHYSGMKFKNTEMIAGNQAMPTHDGENVMTGNMGNGYAKITLLKDPSQNNLLKELQISYDDEKHTIPIDTQDILDKVFSYDDNEYTITVGPEITSLTLYGVQDDVTATVEGNGTYDIPSGTTPIELTVTAESEDIRKYTINVVRQASPNASPVNIEIEGLIESIINTNPEKYGILTNAETGEETEFDPETHEYSMIVPARLKKLAFNVIKGHKYQTVEGDGEYQLAGGENKIEINIISEDGNNVETYIYNIDRDMSGNCMLRSLSVTNLTKENYPTLEEDTDIDFDQDVLEYYLIVPNEVDHLDITAIPEVEDLVPRIIGNNNLKVGLNDIYVIINAKNGEQLVYIIHCYRMMSGNTFLSDLTVTSTDGSKNYELKPAFNKILDTYEVKEVVPNEVTQVVINCAPETNTTIVSGAGVKDLKTGINVFKIRAIAQDGSIGIYNVSVERAKSGNNYLSTLSAGEGNFIDPLSMDENGNLTEKAFEKDILDYTIEVGSDIDHLTLAYTKEDETANVQVSGNSGFKAGNNVVTITVIAENGEQRKYTITVNKEQSTNCYLSNLWTSSGKLSPEFNKETDNYTVEVENEIENIIVSAETEDVRSSLEGTGKYALAIGDNPISILVTAENGDTKTYTLNIVRKLNSNKNLLKVEGTYKITTTDENGEIVSSKNKKVNANVSADGLTYTINVPNDISKINVEGIPEVAKTTVAGNGSKELIVGENNYLLTLTAEDGTTKDYTVIVNRAKSNNCNLKYLFINESNYAPKLNAQQTTYTTTVLSGTTSLTMDIATEDEGATYIVTGNENFIEGENDVKIIVTASDGVTKKEYTIKVFVQSENTTSNYLYSLIVDPGTLDPVFNKETLVYEVELPYEITKTEVTAIAESVEATIEGTGEYNLKVGENDIAVVVTSGDGVKRTYQIKVTRKQSTEARLKSLSIDNHTFTPEFNKNVTTYYLDTSLDKLSINTETLDPNASYEIIGNENFVKGTNNVIIRVTAPDEITTKDYTIVATKTASPNYYLSDLKVVGYSLTPEFNKQTASYTVNVPADVYKVEVRATPEDVTSTVTGVGIVNLNPGKNVQKVVVTSESGKVKTYTVTINKGLSDDNYLKELSVTKGVLEPEFDREIQEYSVELDYEESTEDIIAYANDYRATVTGDGNVSIKVGNNSYNIVVTAEDGSKRTYVINVKRKPAVSALLENLAVSNYEISPTFDSNTKIYGVTVDNEVSTLEKLGLIVKTLDPKATYEITGDSEFEVGLNTVNVEVTSSDGVTKETYILNVTRQMYSNNYLSYIQPSSGTLSPTFDKETISYTIEVENNIENITINAEPEDSNSSLEGTGVYSLDKGENKITLTVTSALGVKRNYNITVIRKKNDNNYLSSLKVKKGSSEMEISPMFDKNTREYVVNGIPAGTSVIQILATPENDLATVTGSGYISLTSAVTEQNITVTAEDGSERDYKLTINRDKSSEANLIELVPSVGSLNPTFIYGKTGYSLLLGNTDDYLSFEVEVQDKTAKVTGNEVQPVPNGESIREIKVTAEDGTEMVYTINVNRIRTDDARLKELTLKEGWNFTPEFNENVYNYTIYVPNDVTTFEQSNVLSAIPKYETSQVTIDGDMELTTKKTNEFKITVLAADGFTTQTYKINIIRAKNDNPYLESLEMDITDITQIYSDQPIDENSLKNIALTPEFDKDTFEYTVTVPEGTNKINIKAKTEDIEATIIGAGEKNIAVGENKFEIISRAENGTEKKYKITVTRPVNTNSYLSNIVPKIVGIDSEGNRTEVKDGTLTPEFDKNTMKYTVSVDNEDYYISFDATPESSLSKVTGTEETYIEESGIERTIIVTAEDGTTKYYDIDVIKNRTNCAKLKSLEIKSYTLDQEFDPDLTEYTLTVPNDKFELTANEIVAKALYVGSTIEYTGIVELSTTELNTYEVTVISPDGTASRVYTLKITRSKSSDSSLKSLSATGYKLDKTFESGITDYVCYVPKGTEIFDASKVVAIPTNSAATVELDGNLDRTIGEKTFKIKVTSEDKSTTTTYILTVEDEKSNNGDLAFLNVTGGTLVQEFDPLTREYDITMTNRESELIIDAEPQDANAVIEEGIGTFTITEESKQILIKVKAEDKSYKIYILNITKDTTPITIKIKGKILTENVNGIYKSSVSLYKQPNAINTSPVSTIETNDDGTYEFEVEAGIYDIIVSKPGYLDYTVRNISITNDDEEIDIGQYKLIAGDVLVDGEIEISDLVGISDKIGTTITDENRGTEGKYDLNEDGVVDIKDRNIIKANYTKKAETEDKETSNPVMMVQATPNILQSNQEIIQPNLDIVQSNQTISQDENEQIINGDMDAIIQETTRKKAKEGEEEEEDDEEEIETVANNTAQTTTLILPLKTGYTVTSPYGERVHPVTGELKRHTGIDLSGEHHAEVNAIAEGEVVYAGDNGAFGNSVEIKHIVNGETIYSFYAHLSQINVEVGQTVGQGEVIGLEGGAESDPGHGSSTGHHLHFEIRTAPGYGNDVDPNEYIAF